MEHKLAQTHEDIARPGYKMAIYEITPKNIDEVLEKTKEINEFSEDDIISYTPGKVTIIKFNTDKTPELAKLDNE